MRYRQSLEYNHHPEFRHLNQRAAGLSRDDSGFVASGASIFATRTVPWWSCQQRDAMRPREVLPLRERGTDCTMKMSRREFGRRMAGSALAVGTAIGCKLNSSQATSDIPIIDTHQHLWDLEKFRPPWIDGEPEVLRRSYVTKDFIEATAGLNVDKAVYMEVDVAPDDQIAEAEHVIALSESSAHPTVGAVISGRPNSPEFESYIRRMAKSPHIKGVRQVLHVPSAPRGLCLEPQFVKSIQLLGELGLSFDLCMRPTELADGLRLAHLCPKTRFIVDHCGNADPKAFLPPGRYEGEKPWHQVAQWKRDMAQLARQENVHCKISGIVVRAPKDDWTSKDLEPIVDFCLDEFGEDKVCFGGDWPVCKLVATYREWVEALRRIISKRSPETQRKLLYDNAAEFYRLG